MKTIRWGLAALVVAGAVERAAAQTNFFWTNTAGNLWSGEIWTNDTGAGLTAPAAGGLADYLINFTAPAGPFNSTNDLGTVANNGFLLNQLVFSNAAVTLSGSNLVFVNNSAGALPKIMQLGASNVIINSSLVLSNNLLFGGGGAGAITNLGSLSGAGGLLKTGSYTLVLSGASPAFDGGITNSGPGRLFVANSAALGSTNGGTVLICNGTSGTGDMLQLGSGVNITNEALTISGSGANRGALYTTTAASFVGTITLNGGNAQFFADASAAKFFIDGLITNVGAGALSLRGASGTGTVAATIYLGTGTALGKTDSSTWILAATNNVWGNTSISTGTIKLGATNALPVTTVVTLGQSSGGNTPTFDLGGFSQTIAGLTTTGAQTGNVWKVTSDAAALLTINNTNNYIYSGTVVKAVGLLKTGTGMLTLSGINSYTGDTTISNGVLRLGSALAAPSSTVAVAVNNGLIFSGVSALNLGGLAGSGALALTNDLGAGVQLGVGQNSASTLFSGALSGAGGLVKLGSGTLTLTGTNTYTGGTVLSAGNLVFGSTNAIADATLTISNGTAMGTAYALDQDFVNRITPVSSGTVALAVNSANALDFSASNLTALSLGAIAGTTSTYSGTLTPAGGLYRLGGGGGTLIVGGVLAGANGLTAFGSGSGGALVLSNNNTYTLGTALPNGTLVLGVTDALPTNTALTLGDAANKTNAGTLDLNGQSQTIGSLATPRIVAGGVTNNATATNAIINLAAGQALNIVTNTTGIVLSVAEGTHLQVSGAGALNINDPQGDIIIAGIRSGSSFMGLDLSQLGTFAAHVDALTVGFDNNNVLRQAVLSLAQTNTLTANTMTVGSSSQVGSLAGKVLLGLSNSLNVANLFVGFGKGLGTVTFADSVTNGSLFLMGTGSVANTRANVTLGSFRNAGGTQPIGSLMITNPGASITASLDTLLLGSLEATNTTQSKGGYGFFTFNNGAVDVNTLILGQSTAAGTTGTGYGQLTMNGGSLVVNSSFTLGKKGDAGTATVTGLVVFAGGSASMNADISDGGGISGLTLSGGQLDMQGHVIGTAPNPIDGLNLQTGTLKNIGEINGGADLVKTGGGTLTLAGNNTYSGGTVISNGTLLAGASAVLPPATRLSADTLGTLDLNGFAQQVGGLDGFRGQVLDTAGGGSLTLNFAAGTNVFSGALLGGTGTRFALTGGGTLNLTGTNSFDGGTLVSNAVYLVNGLHNGGVITVLSNGVVGGSGALSTLLVGGGGTYAPGNSIATQLVASLTLTNAGLLAVELGNNANDKVVVTNSLTVSGGQLQLNLAAYSFNAGANLTVVEWTGATGFTPSDPAEWFTLNDASGPNNGLIWTNGATLAVNGGSGSNNLFTINYNDLANGAGGTQAITLTAVPEPGAAALLGLVGVALLIRRQRRLARA